MNARLDCLTQPWWDLLSRYRAANPVEQGQMRDACFRTWAMRRDDDVFGQLAGATYDEMERLRRAAKATQR
jgi:hypothetical protein